MPCYPCTHCNKCGLFSLKLDLRCATCGTPVAPGASTCPNCGESYLFNTVSGEVSKPEGAVDYYTEMTRVSDSSCSNSKDVGE